MKHLKLNALALTLSTIIIPVAIAASGNSGKDNPVHNDPVVIVKPADVIEADDGLTYLEFEISISHEPTRTVLVFYDTHSIDATPGVDFMDVKGKVHFRPNGRDGLSKKVLVPVFGDREPEANEQLILNISKIINGNKEITPEPLSIAGLATIVDNDVKSLSHSDQVKSLRNLAYEEYSKTFVYSGGFPRRSVPVYVSIDIDADGDEDVVGFYKNPFEEHHHTVLFKNDVSAESGWEVEYLDSQAAPGNGTVIVGDFTGDGLDDLFITGTPSLRGIAPVIDQLLVQRNGTLIEGGQVPAHTRDTSWGDNAYDVNHAVGDIDQDGDLDVFAVMQNGWYAPGNLHSMSHAIYLNDGNGFFTRTHQTDRRHRAPSYSYALSAAIVDYNNDGKMDVYVGTNNSYRAPTSSNEIGYQTFGYGNQLIESNSRGVFTLNKMIGKHTVSMNGHDRGQAATYDVKTADLNNDGFLDIVQLVNGTDYTGVGSSGTPLAHGGWVEINLGQGDGTYQTRIVYNINANSTKLHIEDVNNDGLLDIVPVSKHAARSMYSVWERISDNDPYQGRASTAVINFGNGEFKSQTVPVGDVGFASSLHWVSYDTEYLPDVLK